MGSFLKQTAQSIGKFAAFGMVCIACGWFAAHAGLRDDNDAPRYGATGLPANCRNCGLFGHTWKNGR